MTAPSASLPSFIAARVSPQLCSGAASRSPSRRRNLSRVSCIYFRMASCGPAPAYGIRRCGQPKQYQARRFAAQRWRYGCRTAEPGRPAARTTRIAGAAVMPTSASSMSSTIRRVDGAARHRADARRSQWHAGAEWHTERPRACCRAAYDRARVSPGYSSYLLDHTKTARSPTRRSTG